MKIAIAMLMLGVLLGGCATGGMMGSCAKQNSDGSCASKY